MMDISTLDMITQAGFPIAFCLLLFWQNTNTIRKNTEAMNALTIAIKHWMKK